MTVTLGVWVVGGGGPVTETLGVCVGGWGVGGSRDCDIGSGGSHD